MKRLLGGMLFIDGSLFVTHALRGRGILLENQIWNLGDENSLGEWFQYTKYVVAAIALIAVARRIHSSLFAALSALCGYLLLDDVLLLHERIGGETLGPLLVPTARKADTLGEFLYIALVGTVIIVVLAWLWSRAGQSTRSLALPVIASLAWFGLAVGVIDLFHALVLPVSLDPLGLVLEEGSEMVAATLVVYFVIKAWLATSQHDSSRDAAEVPEGARSA